LNVADSELVHSILRLGDVADADVVLCHQRQGRGLHLVAPAAGACAGGRGADRRVTIGLLGCMAERLKERLLEHDRLVDVV
jgi:tRNA-2-methylthio-N6-dimethylallyladenosine synthase